MKAFLVVSLLMVMGAAADPKCTVDQIVDLPHERDCFRYYHCEKGTIILMSCPEDMHFNAETQSCTSQETANCSLAGCENNDGPICIPSQNWFTYHPHEYRCDKFYRCIYGYKFIKTCYTGTHYNPETKTCVFEEEANCTLCGN